jgi:uncharacterized membrane protein YebE (DUF533 family)
MVQRLGSHARRNLVAYVALVAALAAVGGVAYKAFLPKVVPAPKKPK